MRQDEIRKNLRVLSTATLKELARKTKVFLDATNEELKKRESGEVK